MFSFAIVIFREVLEIALVLGVLVAATKGLQGRNKWVWLGLGAGLAGALIVAAFAEVIANAMAGMGQELFNATILLLAAILIGGTVVWMRRHAKEIIKEVRDVSQAVIHKKRPMYSLALIVMLTVLRDGSETVMFMHGALASGENAFALISGSILGFAVGGGVGYGLYRGILKVSVGKIFSVTSGMLILLAAGMVSQSMGFLSSGGFLPEIVPMVWDTSWIVSDNSWAGQILSTLVGYTARPSALQLIGFSLTIALIAVTLRYYGQPGFLFKMSKFVKAVVVLLALNGIGSIIFVPDAWATKKVYSPLVEKGELEIEARGSYDFDSEASKDGKQKQKYAVGYGMTDRWFTELYGEIEKDVDEDGTKGDFKFTSLEFENIFQLTEQGKYWLDAGLYVAYEASFEEKHADNLEGKILLEKQTGSFMNRANLILEQAVGRHTREDLGGGIAWSTRYRMKPYLEPGFEYHADFGEFSAGKSYQEQSHYVGPVLYGKIGEFKYDIGYLFGLTDAAADGTLKWIIELEKHF